MVQKIKLHLSVIKKNFSLKTKTMKLFLRKSIAIVAISAVAVSCKKESSVQQNGVSKETLALIEAQGFSTENVRSVNGGYLVEGDILLTNENLRSSVKSPRLVIANVEQYRTTNLVKNLPRTITVSVSGTLTGKAVWSNAVDRMIARYNALKTTAGVTAFNLTFQRVASGGNVDVVGFDQGPSGGYITLGSSGFPTSAGDPYNQIKMNTNAQAYGSNPNEFYITSVLQHEMGHCIGFRHTDYFNRALSCGGRKSNEEKPFSSGLGAILIPGTPSGFDAESFMLACSAGTDRSFNANDIKALDYLY